MVDSLNSNSSMAVATESQSIVTGNINNSPTRTDETKKRTLKEMDNFDLSTEEEKSTGQITEGEPSKLMKLNSGQASIVPNDSHTDKGVDDANYTFKLTNPSNTIVNSDHMTIIEKDKGTLESASDALAPLNSIDSTTTIKLSNPDEKQSERVETSTVQASSNITRTIEKDTEVKSDSMMTITTESKSANNTDASAEEKLVVDNGFVFSTTTTGVRSDPTVFKGNIYKSNNHKKTTPKTYNKANKTRGYGRFNKSVIRQQLKEGTISIPLVSPETLAEIVKSGVPLPENIQSFQQNVVDTEETKPGVTLDNILANSGAPKGGQVSGYKRTKTEIPSFYDVVKDDSTNEQKDTSSSKSLLLDGNDEDTEKEANLPGEKSEMIEEEPKNSDKIESEIKKGLQGNKVGNIELKYSISSGDSSQMKMEGNTKDEKSVAETLSYSISKEEEKRLKKEKKKQEKEARSQEKKKKRERMKQLLKEGAEISKTAEKLNTEESSLTKVNSVNSETPKELADTSPSPLNSEVKEEETKLTQYIDFRIEEEAGQKLYCCIHGFVAEGEKEKGSTLNPSDTITNLKSDMNKNQPINEDVIKPKDVLKQNKPTNTSCTFKSNSKSELLGHIKSAHWPKLQSNSSKVEKQSKESESLTISIGPHVSTNPSPRSILPPCTTSPYPYLRGGPSYGPPSMMPNNFKNTNIYNPMNVNPNCVSPYSPFPNASTPELMYNKFHPQEAFGIQNNMQGQRQAPQQQHQRFAQGPLRQPPYPMPPFPYAPGGAPYPTANQMYQQPVPPPGQYPFPRQQRQQPVYPPQRK